MNDPADSPDSELDAMMVKLRNRHPPLHEERTFEFVRKVLEAQARPEGPLNGLNTRLLELRKEYRELLHALKQIGVSVRPDHGQHGLPLDFSTFNGDFVQLAEVMYSLGANKTASIAIIEAASRDIKHLHKSLKGVEEKKKRGAATKIAVRNELARLLNENEEAKGLRIAPLARVLQPRLAASGNSMGLSTIRRHLNDLTSEIIQLAQKSDISKLAPRPKIAAILKQSGGGPGFTEKTVRLALDMPE